MKILKMSTAQYRAYRADREKFIEALRRVYPGLSLQLRLPNGTVFKSVRPENPGSSSVSSKPRLQRWLCRFDTGDPVRIARQEEVDLHMRAKQNDPRGVGAISLGDGKAYYIRDISPEELEKINNKSSKMVSPEPLQMEVETEGEDMEDFIDDPDDVPAVQS